MSDYDSPFVSREDEIDLKLIRLWKAAKAVEKLLFGEHANSTLRARIQPNLEELSLPLAKMNAVLDFDCAELAHVLTGNPYAKLVPDRTPIQDAASWLIGTENGLPLSLQNAPGYCALQEATSKQDTKFFISLGDCLRNKRKIFESGLDLNLKWALSYYWQPSWQLHWPGLVYCKESAIWDFLKWIKAISPKAKHGKNYLSNLIARLGLVPSRKNRFIAVIRFNDGVCRFS